MTALLAKIPVDCPICGTPVDLPLSAGHVETNAGRPYVPLTVDADPLKAHVRTAHLEAVAVPGHPQDAGQNVVVHVQRPPKSAEFALGLARGAAEAFCSPRPGRC
ncbi:hypothetical protein ABTX35_03590 [Streptomyces sp. NPDC096080]|uniref:hypothetical protein n=1 Tax=Streptomyces sp. NPDC096080 TaxID=3156693 RepID=UPI003330D0FF